MFSGEKRVSTSLRISTGSSESAISQDRGVLHVAVLVHDHARPPVVDDLRNGAAPCRDDGRPARHRLDHHEPERLLPVDRGDQRTRPHQQLDLVGMADLPDVLDPAAEVRTDELVEVADLERLAALRERS